jgi:hypothetical protein
MATNRVIPPSTTCSHTTSAASSPVCGRAATEFSIFTASAGRSAIASAGTPVSGQAGPDDDGSAETIEPRNGTADTCSRTAGQATTPAATSATSSTARRPRPDRDRRRPFAILVLAGAPFVDREPFARAPLLAPEREGGAVDLGTSGLLARRGGALPVSARPAGHGTTIPRDSRTA